MSLRTIMIFPKFSNQKIIDEIRKEYDPLYDLVKPHITLVFPFEDPMTDIELENNLQLYLKGIKPFKLVLQGIRKEKDDYGNYIFLHVKQGSEEIIEIHKRLYSNIWGKSNNSLYVPHMTIGKLKSEEEMNLAYNKLKNLDTYFETYIDQVAVEMIGPHDESIIIIEKNL